MNGKTSSHVKHKSSHIDSLLLAIQTNAFINAEVYNNFNVLIIRAIKISIVVLSPFSVFFINRFKEDVRTIP